MDRTQELEEQVRRLSRTVEEMRARMARLEGGVAAPAEEKRSRRSFLGMGAAAAAGALGVAASRVIPVAAANGDPMTVGNTMTGTSPTILSGSDFEAKDSGFVQGDLDAALPNLETFTGPHQALGGDGSGADAEGLDAFAHGALAFGVWGLTDSGVGVTGEANTGIGLYARGTGRIRQDPQGFAGDPTPAVPNGPDLMEQVRDANGVLWIHNSLGIWRRVNSLRTDASSGNGHAFKPLRLYDSRQHGGKKAAGSTNVFQVTGAAVGTDSEIPADAVAVVGNLTATGYGGAGFLAIMPQGASFNPSTDPSSLNFIVGQGAIANAFVCGLNPTNGQLQVYVGGSASNFIIDITAYIQ